MKRLKLKSRLRLIGKFIVCAILTACFADVSAADARFNSGSDALKIPFKLQNNHIYLRVGVNNSKPFWLLLDTGAPNIINLRLARTLNLKLTPAGQGEGVGEAKVEAWVAENVSFTLPGVAYTVQKVGVVSLDNVEECSDKITADLKGRIALRPKPARGDEKQPIDGVLGDGFFKNFVVEIDYSAQIINLYDPQNYRYSGGGQVIPIELTDNHIYLRASISAAKQTPVKTRLMIDTGSMAALILNRPFVEKNKLLPPAEQTTPFAVCGIGGDSQTQIGTLEKLEFGSLSIENPVTMFSQAESGVLTRTNYDGNIGNAILRRYRVIFDYSRKQMILESASK